MIDLIEIIKYIQTDLPDFTLTLSLSVSNRVYIRAVDIHDRVYLLSMADFPVSLAHTETNVMNWVIRSLRNMKDEGLNDYI